MILLRCEMETIVNYNAEDDKATVYTRDKSVMRRLDRLVSEYPMYYRLLKETALDKTYEFPKYLVSFRKPRVYTQEQREQARNQIKQINRDKDAAGQTGEG